MGRVHSLPLARPMVFNVLTSSCLSRVAVEDTTSKETATRTQASSFIPHKTLKQKQNFFFLIFFQVSNFLAIASQLRALLHFLFFNLLHRLDIDEIANRSQNAKHKHVQ